MTARLSKVRILAVNYVLCGVKLHPLRCTYCTGTLKKIAVPGGGRRAIMGCLTKDISSP